MKLTKAKQRQAIEAYADKPIYAHAAKAVGVTESAIRQLRDRDPAFAAALDQADEQHTERLFAKTRAAIEKHLDAALAGEEKLNPAIIDKVLQRVDRRWTAQHSTVEHSGSLTIDQVIEQATQARREAE